MTLEVSPHLRRPPIPPGLELAKGVSRVTDAEFVAVEKRKPTGG
jgi:hypothetical protein